MPVHTLKNFHFTAAFCDPASGKKSITVKKTRARSAIIVASTDINNRVFVRKSWAERCSTAELYEEIYRTNSEFRLDVFGIEGSAQQSLFVDLMALDAAQRRISIPLRNVKQPTNITKEFRIRVALQPRLKDGQLFFRTPEDDALVEELLAFPMGDTVDMVDAFASLTTMIPEKVSLNESREEEEALLQYLRDSGAPAAYIEEAHRQLSGQPQSLGIEGWAEMYGLQPHRR